MDTALHTKCSLAYLSTCMEIPWFFSRFQFHADVDISNALVVLRSLSALTEAHRPSSVVGINPSLSKGFKAEVRVHPLNMGPKGPDG